MTREDIDRALKSLHDRSDHADLGEPARIALFAGLLDIVAEQERRLRVLEPCDMSPREDAPHAWSPSRTCIWCGVRQ